jgi:hypothetical protein
MKGEILAQMIRDRVDMERKKIIQTRDSVSAKSLCLQTEKKGKELLQILTELLKKNYDVEDLTYSDGILVAVFSCGDVIPVEDLL